MLGPAVLPTCLVIRHNVHVKGLQAYRDGWGGGCGSSGDACVAAGGHAAHFANIDQCSPMFSQERAPTSVAYAENQSMFLDSFIDDAAWKGRYALSRYLLHLEALPVSQLGVCAADCSGMCAAW